MFIKQTKTLIALVFLMCSLPAYSANVVQIEIESSKNGVSKGVNTNIITIDEKKWRLDYLGTEKTKTETTPFLLTLNGGKNWTLADSQDNEFYCAKIEMNDFFRDLGNIMWQLNSLANAKFPEMKLELLLEEPGPEISGYATTHLRFQTSVKANARILFKKFEYGMTKVDDIWYTKDLQIHPAKKRWIEALTHSGYEHIDQLSSDLRSSIPGPVLKQNSVIKITDYKNDQVDTYERKIRVVSIKELESSEVPKDTFTRLDCEDIDESQIKDAAGSIFREGRLNL